MTNGQRTQQRPRRRGRVLYIGTHRAPMVRSGGDRSVIAAPGFTLVRGMRDSEMAALLLTQACAPRRRR